MKIEPTFIFVALLVLGITGYGISGNFLNEPKPLCELECKNITLQQVDACIYNGTYFKKDFFLRNMCPQDKITECESQLCGEVQYLNQTNFDRCMKLCDN